MQRRRAEAGSRPVESPAMTVNGDAALAHGSVAPPERGVVYTVYMPKPSTARRVVGAARRLVEKDGIDGVTMRRVAEAVSITPMAIYRHFPDRAALLDAIAQNAFDELAADLEGKRFTGAIETRLTKMADLFLDHALENPRLFELMFLAKREGARRYPLDFKARRSPTATLMADSIAEAMKTGELKKDDHWEITFELGALSHGLILLYLGGRVEMTPTRFRTLYRRSFRRHLDGLRA
jgi:AcrR family transcriptional regulator